MKSKDVQIGVIYAYRVGSGRLSAVRVLDMQRYRSGLSRFGNNAGTPLNVLASGQTGTFDEGTGFLAVSNEPSVGRWGASPKSVSLSPLRSVTLEQALSQRHGMTSTPPMPQDAFVVRVNPRWILGKYDEIVEAETEAKSIAQDLEQMAIREAQDVADLANVRIDALARLNLPGSVDRSRVTSTGYGRDRRWLATSAKSIHLTVEQIDALLSLIPEGTRYEPISVEPDVEDDGWTYAQGPTAEGLAPIVVVEEEQEEAPAEPAVSIRVRKPNGTYESSSYSSQSLWAALHGEDDRRQHSVTYAAVTGSASRLARLISNKDGRGSEEDAKRTYGQWQRFSGMPTPQPIIEDFEPEVLYVKRSERNAPYVRYSSLNLKEKI